MIVLMTTNGIDHCISQASRRQAIWDWTATCATMDLPSNLFLWKIATAVFHTSTPMCCTISWWMCINGVEWARKACIWIISTNVQPAWLAFAKCSTRWLLNWLPKIKLIRRKMCWTNCAKLCLIGSSRISTMRLSLQPTSITDWTILNQETANWKRMPKI